MRTSMKIQKKKFYIPNNVYIIGTMNDIDRSVDTFDFAMRRRFTFLEIKAEDSAQNMLTQEKTKELMTRLNEAIVAKEKVDCQLITKLVLVTF